MPEREFEVEMQTNVETRTFAIGFSPSEAEAEERARSLYERNGVRVISFRVLRVLREFSPASTCLSQLTPAWTEGRFVLHDSQGRESASEYGGAHLLAAWNFLTRDRPEAIWKTAAVLKAFRQAIREDSVNCQIDALAVLTRGASTRTRVSEYLRGARVRDFVHHGARTF